MLSFANVYFFESGLFNGLQPIQIKKSFLFQSSTASASFLLFADEAPPDPAKSKPIPDISVFVKY
jgi:hypothetical protein